MSRIKGAPGFLGSQVEHIRDVYEAKRKEKKGFWIGMTFNIAHLYDGLTWDIAKLNQEIERLETENRRLKDMIAAEPQ